MRMMMEGRKRKKGRGRPELAESLLVVKIDELTTSAPKSITPLPSCSGLESLRVCAERLWVILSFRVTHLI